MAHVQPEEVISALKHEPTKFEGKLQLDSVGTILQVGDGIARLYGLDDVMAGELLEFPGNIVGMALNLEEHNVGAVILGDDRTLKDGDTVKRTGTIAQVPVWEALIGRVVDALGRPVDGQGPIAAKTTRPVFGSAPNVVQRPPA